MRRRLQKFLPIVLLALAVQILAPIAACWAAAIAASDPLQSAGICHDSAGSGQSDQSGAPGAHDGACSICCATHAGAAIDAPKTAAIVLGRAPQRVVWQNAALHLSPSRTGSNAQARAPPQLT